MLPNKQGPATMTQQTQLTQPQRTWLAALRSGQFTQGHGCLKDRTNAYCCLGVAVQEIFKVSWQQEKTGLARWYYGWYMNRSYPDPDHTAQLGLTATDVDFCIAMNDQYQYSFATIAELLEARWLSGEWN